MDSRRALLVIEIMKFFVIGILMDTALILSLLNQKRRKLNNSSTASYSLLDRMPSRINLLDKLTKNSERKCIKVLRMGRNAIGRLCIILRDIGGLADTREVTVGEQVCIFLGVLSHQKKNCIAKFDFERSGCTVSKYFHVVLKAVLKLHGIFIAKPVPVEDDCTDHTWKWFKGCLGALDGTLIEVTVPEIDKGRYRSRKGKCQVNVLGVCDRKCNFVYVLTGWEGSAADGRVIRDALQRPNRFRVPEGNYYLCDAGYTNGNGFLAPYRAVRYHLQEWGCRAPQNAKELFNKRRSSARTTIERAWGILKGRWAILRSPSFYEIKIQNQIIMACTLLHNFIRGEMAVDPVENELIAAGLLGVDAVKPPTEYIPHIETSQAWTDFRDTLANDMWTIYSARRR